MHYYKEKALDYIKNEPLKYLKLYLLKNQVMLVLGKHSHTSHVEELSEVWREIVYCGDSFVTHSEYFEAGKLYNLA